MRRRSCAFGFALFFAAAGLVAALEEHRTTNGGRDAGAPTGPTPRYRRASVFATTRPIRSLPPMAASVKAGQSIEDVEIPMKPLPRDLAPEGAAPALVGDPVAQKSMAAITAAPAPNLTFEGINNVDNANAFGFRVLPPDTNGDVGPDHYVQMVNLLFRIWDKTGTPLIPPTKLSSVFAPLGGICSTNDNGDPVVLYDHLADRWLLSQFAFMPTGLPPYHMCIAISQTGDPTGAYFLYDFVTFDGEFPDYPKFGVWPDGYYMTANQFFNFGPFDGTGAYAFDRTKMLAGDPTASYIYFNLDLASHPEGVGGMLPSDLDGPAPPDGTPNYFTYFIATEFGDAEDALRMFDFHADFANPGLSTFTERPESPISVAPFDPTFNSASGACPPSLTGFNFRDDFEQPPIPLAPEASCNARLDAIADRLLHRQQYRNRGGYETLVTNHTVDVNMVADSAPGYQGGVRYYELRRALPGGAFDVNEQGSFAPDTDNRWMGSAAEDSNGNLAVGYSVVSPTTFPSIRFAGRVTSDPPGGLFQGEASLMVGAGSQGNSASRWGDYSGLVVDPSDGCTFWYTNQYYKTTSPEGRIACPDPVNLPAFSNACWSTRIGSFRFPTCVGALSVDKPSLWPPNHKLVLVTVDYTSGPSVDCMLTVSSDEPVNGTDDGDTAPDWVIVDDHHVQLRAERAGSGDGRVYTILVTCTDGDGNSSSHSVEVIVPLEQ